MKTPFLGFSLLSIVTTVCGCVSSEDGSIGSADWVRLHCGNKNPHKIDMLREFVGGSLVSSRNSRVTATRLCARGASDERGKGWAA